MLDKVLVTAFCLVLGLVIFMQTIFLVLPIFKRMELDALGHRYAMLMEESGGLDSKRVGDLESLLQERGFQVQSLQATSQASYGDLLEIEIEAEWPSPRLTGHLTIRKEETCFQFHAQMKNRIVHADWVP